MKRVFRVFGKWLWAAPATLWLCLCVFVTSVLGWVYFSESLLLSNSSLWNSSLITSAFIHANIPHLVGNLFALFALGRVVEKKVGAKKFVLVYVFALFFSSVGTVVLHNVVGVEFAGLGASGAIAGVIAAAMLYAPWSFTWYGFIPLPVFVVAILAISGDVLALGSNSGVGHLTHLLGYISSAVLMFSLSSERKQLYRGLSVSVLSASIVYSILLCLSF